MTKEFVIKISHEINFAFDLRHSWISFELEQILKEEKKEQ